MNSDIRISVSFKDHRKRKRLRMMLGDRATDYLLDLWISTALNHPSGFLKGMETLDIALDAEYDGTDPDGFVKALVACGLIEYIEEKSCYHVHDWEKHQVYAIHAEARSAQASKAANSRWANKNTVAASPPNTQPTPEEQRTDAPNAARMLPAYKTDARNMHFYAPSNAPSPSPSPSPNPEIQRDIPPPKINLDTKIACAREKNAEDGEDPDFTTLREFWDEHCRQEGRLTGLAELKMLKKAQKWPNIDAILLDIRRKIEMCVWKPTYAPSLRNYLREEWYAVNITTTRSRDSLLRPSGVTENNFAVDQQVLKKIGEKNETTSAT